MERRPGLTVGGAILIAAIQSAPELTAQVASLGPDTITQVSDTRDFLGAARAAQVRFERRRIRYLPITIGVSGSCDEHVGRFCSWYDEGDWYPLPEAPQISTLRTELLVALDSAQEGLPGDDWVLGQRVWYRADAGRWEDALTAARRCGSVERWWCAALEGFALHGLERYAESRAAFSVALAGMPDAEALEWRLPRRAMDGEGRDLLNDLRGVPGDSVSTVLRRLWALADPLYLVDGNDRETAHYARWTVSSMRERARNAYSLPWGDDLEELMVRHGWEVGWERSPCPYSNSLDDVIGHKHPEGRDYMPAGRALKAPSLATPEDLRADVRGPRSLYAPAYAPLMLPMEGQVAVFPRGAHMVIVASHFLPEDTTRHAKHRHPLPWLEPGDQRGMPNEAGLFLVQADASVVSARSRGATEGVLSIEAPVGSYVLSAEVWSPELRRAGRFRVGLERSEVPADVAALSDLLMLAPPEVWPEKLDEAVEHALPRAEILPGQTFAIGWEVTGLGFRTETLFFELSVTRTDRSVLSRIGGFLGISRPTQRLRLEWEEPGPEAPSPLFRYLDLDLPALDVGAYEVRLVLRTAGRSDVVAVRPFSVRERS
jgi:hypothetical protein